MNRRAIRRMMKYNGLFKRKQKKSVASMIERDKVINPDSRSRVQRRKARMRAVNG